RYVRAFDVLMHLAKAGDGHQVRFVKALANFSGKCPSRPDPCDAAAVDDNFLIFSPGAAMDVEKAAHTERAIGRTLAERHQRQLLTNADLAVPSDLDVVAVVQSFSLHPFL